MELMAFVPYRVRRRFAGKSSKPLTDPLLENFTGATVFIDISGFTALTARMASLGPSGIEQLCDYLNQYFTKMINIIEPMGGDVIKFAGDAIQVIWSHDPKSGVAYEHTICVACQCAFELTATLNRFQIDTDLVLSLHIGVGAGKLFGLHVGGVNGRWEYLIAGDAVNELKDTVDEAKMGEVAVSEGAWACAQKIFAGGKRGKAYVLSALTNRIPSDAMIPIPRPAAAVETQFLECVKSYIPAVVNARYIAKGMAFLAENRRLTVLFARIPSLTFTDAKSIDPAHKATVLVQQVVMRHEGTMHQFMVDDKGAVMLASFGLVAHENDAQWALKAALELKEGLTASYPDFSIGLTTGTVFAGAIGSPTRKAYTIIGDVVNMSARLMCHSLAARGVLCDAATQEASGESFRFRRHEPISVKGRDTPMLVYTPVGVRQWQSVTRKQSRRQQLNGPLIDKIDDAVTSSDAPPMASGVRRGSLRGARSTINIGAAPKKRQTAFVGRREELGKVKRSLDSVKLQKACVMLLEGDAGMGKSAMVDVVCRNAANEGFDVLRAGALDIERGTPFYVWCEIMLQMCDLVGGPLAGRRRATVTGRSLASESMFSVATTTSGDFSGRSSMVFGGGDLKGSELVDYVHRLVEEYDDLAPLLPLLNALLPMNLPETDATREMAGSLRMSQLFYLIGELIQRRALTKPIALVIDDAHWIDSASWALTCHIAELAIPGLLLGVMSRPLALEYGTNIPAEWTKIRELPHTQHLPLEGLPIIEIRQLVASCLGADDCAVEVAEYIEGKSRGNPLFVEQLVDILKNMGHVDVVGGMCMLRATGVDAKNLELEVPNSMKGIITGRFDRLPLPQQSILKTASVIGRLFPINLLWEVMRLSDASLSESDLEAAITEIDMVVEVDTAVEFSFMFSSDVFRDVVYSLLTKTQAADLHKRVAGFLEMNESPNWAIIAFHWSKTRKIARTIEANEMAAKAAFDGFAVREAISHYETALAIVNDSKHVRASMTPQKGREAIPPDEQLPPVGRDRIMLWISMLGRCHVMITEFKRADEYFRIAFEHYGERLPQTTFKKILGILKQIRLQKKFKKERQKVESDRIRRASQAALVSPVEGISAELVLSAGRSRPPLILKKRSSKGLILKKSAVRPMDISEAQGEGGKGDEKRE
eukprot:Opistho-2@30472